MNLSNVLFRPTEFAFLVKFFYDAFDEHHVLFEASRQASIHFRTSERSLAISL